MPEAVKPATDNTAKPAVETDASKKEKAAADGAHDKLAKEAADATKPGDAKKPEDAAKKPEDVAKKPEEAAKTPAAEKSWTELALDEVRNLSIASWMGIKAPDKPHVAPKVEVAAKANTETAGVLDFSSNIIPGYDVKGNLSTAASTDLKLDKLGIPEPAKQESEKSWFSSVWDSTKQTFSDGYNWTKDAFSKLGDWSVSAMDQALEQSGKLSAQEYIKSFDGKADYKVTTLAGPDDALKKILVDYGDGSSTTLTEKSRIKEKGDTKSIWNPETRESHITKGESGTYDRLADGTQIFTQKDGTRVIYRGKDQVDVVSKAADGSDVIQRVEGKNVYQKYGVFVVGDEVGTAYSTLAQMKKHHHMGRHESVVLDNGGMVEGDNGVKLLAKKDQTATIATQDGGSIELDIKTNRAVHKDSKGQQLESGSIEDILRLPAAKGLRFDHDKRTISVDGSSTVYHYDESGKLTSVATDEQGRKLVRVLGEDGSVQTQYKAANGEILAQNKVNHSDPEHMFVQQNVRGETVATFNYNKHEYEAADNSFKFSESGTELFGGEIHVDRYSGDISYSDGTRLSNSSSGALQASEAAATSASVNATSVASQLSAKAGNPATISSGDLSQCYTAYGSISAALQQCLASGNFAGVGQCLAAQGALASAIGVIAPKLNAMDDARKAGLSGYAINEVGQDVGQGGGMNPYKAIQEIWARQNGQDRVQNS
jgi:hypothetical protein